MMSTAKRGRSEISTTVDAGGVLAAVERSSRLSRLALPRHPAPNTSTATSNFLRKIPSKAGKGMVAPAASAEQQLTAPKKNSSLPVVPPTVYDKHLSVVLTATVTEAMLLSDAGDLHSSLDLLTSLPVTLPECVGKGLWWVTQCTLLQRMGERKRAAETLAQGIKSCRCSPPAEMDVVVQALLGMVLSPQDEGEVGNDPGGAAVGDKGEGDEVRAPGLQNCSEKLLSHLAVKDPRSEDSAPLPSLLSMVVSSPTAPFHHASQSQEDFLPEIIFAVPSLQGVSMENEGKMGIGGGSPAPPQPSPFASSPLPSLGQSMYADLGGSILKASGIHLPSAGATSDSCIFPQSQPSIPLPSSPSLAPPNTIDDQNAPTATLTSPSPKGEVAEAATTPRTPILEIDQRVVPSVLLSPLPLSPPPLSLTSLGEPQVGKPVGGHPTQELCLGMEGEGKHEGSPCGDITGDTIADLESGGKCPAVFPLPVPVQMGSVLVLQAVQARPGTAASLGGNTVFLSPVRRSVRAVRSALKAEALTKLSKGGCEEGGKKIAATEVKRPRNPPPPAPQSQSITTLRVANPILREALRSTLSSTSRGTLPVAVRAPLPLTSRPPTPRDADSSMNALAGFAPPPFMGVSSPDRAALSALSPSAHEPLAELLHAAVAPVPFNTVEEAGNAFVPNKALPGVNLTQGHVDANN